MFNKKTVRDLPVEGKVVLVRTDYNVPLTEDGEIADDLRIRASLPTLKYLLDNGAKKVVIISHLGRPKGERNLKYSLRPVAKRLGELLPGHELRFVDEVTGAKVNQAVEELPDGGVLVLDNLRFDAREEENDAAFAEEIVADTGADLFVQEGFAVTHRAHASTDAIAKLLPAVAGFLVADEVGKLTQALENPKRPLVVIIGGSKVEDKQPLVNAFLPIADKIIVGGKIAADGYRSNDEKVYVAEDFVEDKNGAKLDIGEQSVAEILRLIKGAGTVVWNGTLGLVEKPEYAVASHAVAEALGRSDAEVIIGGGDTAAYVESVLAEEPDLHFALISTGGGASLELLTGKKLPGVEVLQDLD